MILLRSEILKRVNDGRIVITPFNQNQLNPNSYNLKLGPKILVYDDLTNFHPYNCNSTRELLPDESGAFLLLPNTLYLARTFEYTETHDCVPMIEGRSSLGRLGVFIHITAGFGDLGFCGYWTLEIVVVHPILLYVGMEICQIFYHTTIGTSPPYTGRYQNNNDVQASRLHIK